MTPLSLSGSVVIEFQTWLHTFPSLLSLGRTQVEMPALGAHLATDGWDKSQGGANNDNGVPESWNISLWEASSQIPRPGQGSEGQCLACGKQAAACLG